MSSQFCQEIVSLVNNYGAVPKSSIDAELSHLEDELHMFDADAQARATSNMNNAMSLLKLHFTAAKDKQGSQDDLANRVEVLEKEKAALVKENDAQRRDIEAWVHKHSALAHQVELLRDQLHAANQHPSQRSFAKSPHNQCLSPLTSSGSRTSTVGVQTTLSSHPQTIPSALPFTSLQSGQLISRSQDSPPAFALTPSSSAAKLTQSYKGASATQAHPRAARQGSPNARSLTPTNSYNNNNASSIVVRQVSPGSLQARSVTPTSSFNNSVSATHPRGVRQVSPNGRSALAATACRKAMKRSATNPGHPKKPERSFAIQVTTPPHSALTPDADSPLVVAPLRIHAMGVLARNDIAGANLQDVAAGSPAEATGLKVGDVIFEVHGKSVSTARDLLQVSKTMPSKNVTIGFIRITTTGAKQIQWTSLELPTLDSKSIQIKFRTPAEGHATRCAQRSTTAANKATSLSPMRNGMDGEFTKKERPYITPLPLHFFTRHDLMQADKKCYRTRPKGAKVK
ncbi:hypothetical protein DIPPA_35262 [Diplonema papillatum]|nr:hypothetical protein DIPPA_35262 [Diplonema papillatum]